MGCLIIGLEQFLLASSSPNKLEFKRLDEFNLKLCWYFLQVIIMLILSIRILLLKYLPG